MTIEQKRAAFDKSGCCIPGDAAMNNHNWLIWRDAWQAAIASVSAQQTGNWHAPGLGEVHSADHKQMIYCMTETGAEDEPEIIDDELASQVCAALNGVPVSTQPVELTAEEIADVIDKYKKTNNLTYTRAVLAAQRAKEGRV